MPRSRDSKSCEPCAKDRLAPGACSPASGARCALWRELWHWALGADGGHGHAQPPFRSSRLIGAERQPTSDCRQSLQQSLRRHAHLALVHTSIEHSRDWCRSLLILNCQELAAQQPLRPINWCSRLLKMTIRAICGDVQENGGFLDRSAGFRFFMAGHTQNR